MLSRQTLLASAAKDYMNAEQLAFFKAELQTLREETMRHIEQAKQQLARPPECNDEGDRSQHEEDVRISLRIVDRERKLLPKIDKALWRIANGSYGYCEETGEPIGIARLLIRPTAEFCTDIKTINERREQNYAE
ncbi:MAG TPA: RNA polymerase-binding protein DksA [Cellvibrionaceae bacterium]